jgi:hypothetical protein
MLLPRALDMSEAGSHMPLPPPRPRILQLAVNNHSKGSVDTANSDENRRAATKSVRQAVPARLQPARASRPAS